jgi:tetratricopeptide (TPR) repeat protein
MPAIFISHSSLDPKEADDIKASLAHLGFERVFLDFDKATGIDAGENWEKRLYEELARCHAVILILTPNWMASKWCFAELTQARALGKVILPIICKPLAERLVLPEVQAIDLLDWNAGGLARLEQRLLAIKDELARGFTLHSHRPPYPGIHAFEEEDAAIYFGRDDETRAVIERLDARRTQGGARFLVIIGASGSGKSSLLRAGVLPQLGRRKAQWIVLPTIRPEKAPLEALAKSITQQIGQSNDWRIWHQKVSGADAADHFADLLKDMRVGDARAATVLLPIDQFEEVFTVAELTERDAFLRFLASAADPLRDLPIMVVATGRSDVLDGLVESGALAQLTETYPLPPMPLDRVPRLVEGPAAVAGLNVEAELAEAISGDVENAEALPLLAHALWLLHRGCAVTKRLTLSEYKSLGDAERGLNPIQNSVRLAAEQAIGGLRPAPTDTELAALRDAFVPHLVRMRLDDGKQVRQPGKTSELPSASLRLIRALVQARLLTTRDGLVEVAHEALFRAWPTLANWLSEEQAFLTDLERIRGAHEIWDHAPVDAKDGALLHGLLLSRARDWLIKYPQRFAGSTSESIRTFIAESATAEDAERTRIRRNRRWRLQATAAAAIAFAAVAAVAGWQYYQAQHNFNIAKQAAEHVVFRISGDLRNVKGMRVESIRRILDAAQAMMDELGRAAPNDLRLQRSRSVMLNEFTEIYIGAGDLPRATTAAEGSLAIMRKLATVDPGNAGWQRDLSFSLESVGDVRLYAGDRARALTAYEESLAIRRTLAAADKGNVERQHDVSVTLGRVGDLRLNAGDPAGALAVYEEGLAIIRKLASADPGNAGWQRELSVSLAHVGDVRLAVADRVGGLAAYEESLAIIRKLAASDPDNARWQRDVSASLIRVGDVRRGANDRAGALAAYEEGLRIMRNLAAADPGNTEWQRDLSFSLVRVGDMLVTADDGPRALAAYEEGLAILRKLVSADRGNVGWQRELSVTLVRVGDMKLAAGNRTGALVVYEESLSIMRKLAAADPDNSERQADLVGSLYKVSTASDAARARKMLREAQDILKLLARENKLTTAQQNWSHIIRDALAKLPPEEAEAR